MNVINQVVLKSVCQCSRNELTIKLVFDRDEKKTGDMLVGVEIE